MKVSMEMLIAKYGKKARIYDVLVSLRDKNEMKNIKFKIK